MPCKDKCDGGCEGCIAAPGDKGEYIHLSRPVAEDGIEQARRQVGQARPPGDPGLIDPMINLRGDRTHQPIPGSPVFVPDEANPKDLIGDTKPDISLVPPAALVYMALAMGDGARKYGPFNWREKKVKTRVYIAACMRHLLQYLDGEEEAEDSGRPHLAHAMACLGIIVDAKETGNLVDDRPAAGAASELIARYTRKQS